MRKTFRLFEPESPEYVVLHSQWRASRGKAPSESYKGIRNPNRALALAQSEANLGKIDNVCGTNDDDYPFEEDDDGEDGDDDDG